MYKTPSLDGEGCFLTKILPELGMDMANISFRHSERSER